MPTKDHTSVKVFQLDKWMIAACTDIELQESEGLEQCEHIFRRNGVYYDRHFQLAWFECDDMAFTLPLYYVDHIQWDLIMSNHRERPLRDVDYNAMEILYKHKQLPKSMQRLFEKECYIRTERKSIYNIRMASRRFQKAPCPCHLFEQYDDQSIVRTYDNCDLWLRNNGECPYEIEVQLYYTNPDIFSFDDIPQHEQHKMRWFVERGVITKFDRGFCNKREASQWIDSFGRKLDWRTGYTFKLRYDFCEMRIVNKAGDTPKT